MTEIIKSVGSIDVLVPCATSTEGANFSPAKDTKTDTIAELYSVNVIGLFHLVHEFMALPSTASGPKSVLHVSSAASQLFAPGQSGYCSSKAAANQIITHFGFDNPAGNVKFYSFHPGAIQTPIVKENLPADFAVWENGELRMSGLNYE